MLFELKKIIEIGKELGLTKKEITQFMIFDNSKNAYIWRVFLIVFMLLIMIGWISSIVFLTEKINENVYPSGTLYSTTKLKDFKKKFRII